MNSDTKCVLVSDPFSPTDLRGRDADLLPVRCWTVGALQWVLVNVQYQFSGGKQQTKQGTDLEHLLVSDFPGVKTLPMAKFKL